MTGRTATDNRIVRHQQERDLGHDLDTPRDGDGDAEVSIEERRRRAGRENNRRAKPRS